MWMLVVIILEERVSKGEEKGWWLNWALLTFQSYISDWMFKVPREITLRTKWRVTMVIHYVVPFDETFGPDMQSAVHINYYQVQIVLLTNIYFWLFQNFLSCMLMLTQCSLNQVSQAIISYAFLIYGTHCHNTLRGHYENLQIRFALGLHDIGKNWHCDIFFSVIYTVLRYQKK